MTTRVRIFTALTTGLMSEGVTAGFAVQESTGADFGAVDLPFEASVGHHGYGITIKRLEDDAKGFILNCGPDPLHVHYSLEETGKAVGPETDYVYPGQFKEIGAAKGILWHVKST